MKANIFLAVCFCAVFVDSYIVNPGPKYVATKGAVWPKPQSQSVSDNYFTLVPSTFEYVKNGTTCNLLDNALQRYYKILQKNTLNEVPTNSKKKRETGVFSILADETGENLGQLTQLRINLDGKCDDTAYPTLNMDESYSLELQGAEASLNSTSIWGVLRGLETFSQLVYRGVDGSIRANSSTIVDFPRFKHRGLLLDTARHFIPIEQIHQIIDGLAYNKMNVFHWHIVDDQSFPYVSQKFPELSQMGAYHPELFIYTPTQVQEVIEYARQRGIRVMPELDTPGHTRSWGVSHPELLTKCDGIVKGSYGPIDPSKNTTYSFLQDLLAEFRTVFKDEFIHLGGDEVDFDCWEIDENINKFMADNNISSYADLEGYYIQKIIDMAARLKFVSVVWEEVFRNGVKLPNETIVHVWRDYGSFSWTETMYDVTNANQTALLSAPWYLDHLANDGDWEKFYQYEPTDFGGSDQQKELVLGGEACMWAEVVNEYNVVPRIWPRASAPAEKLWSPYDDSFDQETIAKRLEEHVCRMNTRGIPAQPPNSAGFCL